MTNPRVAALDDYFPDLSTGFRIAEFNWLLRNRVIDRVLTTAALSRVMGPYRGLYPDLAPQIEAFAPAALGVLELASMVFLNNAAHFRPYLEAAGVPYVVTLYPGGGLDLEDPDSRQKLTALLDSDLLRAVITTQPLVTDAVRDSGTRARVVEIPGVVVNPVYLAPGAGSRESYFEANGRGGELRICFLAHKYHPTGADKGYDIFLDVVRELAGRLPVSAHVIGGFTASDLPVQDIERLVTFYGAVETSALKEILFGMDLVVAPNRAGVLGPGSFDGFPTGSSIEAALCGVAMVVSDPRRQNRAFRDGRDIVITPPDAAHIAGRIVDLIDAPGGIRRVARAGLAVARAAYGVEAQLWSRRRVIEGVRRSSW